MGMYDNIFDKKAEQVTKTAGSAATKAKAAPSVAQTIAKSGLKKFGWFGMIGGFFAVAGTGTTMMLLNDDEGDGIIGGMGTGSGHGHSH